MQVTINTPHNSFLMTVKSWWNKQAYRHKSAEFLMYFMFASGLLLWENIPVMWQIKRWALLTHLLIGTTLFTVVVGLFWSAHRRLIQRSNKQFLRQTGTIIEWLLVACSLTGIYLFLFGNPGNTLGWLAQEVHFYSSWLLTPLVCRHALRWSILRFKK